MGFNLVFKGLIYLRVSGSANGSYLFRLPEICDYVNERSGSIKCGEFLD